MALTPLTKALMPNGAEPTGVTPPESAPKRNQLTPEEKMSIRSKAIELSRGGKPVSSTDLATHFPDIHPGALDANIPLNARRGAGYNNLTRQGVSDFFNETVTPSSVADVRQPIQKYSPSGKSGASMKPTIGIKNRGGKYGSTEEAAARLAEMIWSGERNFPEGLKREQFQHRHQLETALLNIHSENQKGNAAVGAAGRAGDIKEEAQRGGVINTPNLMMPDVFTSNASNVTNTVIPRKFTYFNTGGGQHGDRKQLAIQEHLTPSKASDIISHITEFRSFGGAKSVRGLLDSYEDTQTPYKDGVLLELARAFKANKHDRQYASLLTNAAEDYGQLLTSVSSGQGWSRNDQKQVTKDFFNKLNETIEALQIGDRGRASKLGKELSTIVSHGHGGAMAAGVPKSEFDSMHQQHLTNPSTFTNPHSMRFVHPENGTEVAKFDPERITGELVRAGTNIFATKMFGEFSGQANTKTPQNYLATTAVGNFVQALMSNTASPLGRDLRTTINRRVSDLKLSDPKTMQALITVAAKGATSQTNENASYQATLGRDADNAVTQRVSNLFEIPSFLQDKIRLNYQGQSKQDANNFSRNVNAAAAEIRKGNNCNWGKVGMLLRPYMRENEFEYIMPNQALAEKTSGGDLAQMTERDRGPIALFGALPDGRKKTMVNGPVMMQSQEKSPSGKIVDVERPWSPKLPNDYVTPTRVETPAFSPQAEKSLYVNNVFKSALGAPLFDPSPTQRGQLGLSTNSAEQTVFTYGVRGVRMLQELEANNPKLYASLFDRAHGNPNQKPGAVTVIPSGKLTPTTANKLILGIFNPKAGYENITPGVKLAEEILNSVPSLKARIASRDEKVSIPDTVTYGQDQRQLGAGQKQEVDAATSAQVKDLVNYYVKFGMSPSQVADISVDGQTELPSKHPLAHKLVQINASPTLSKEWQNFKNLENAVLPSLKKGTREGDLQSTVTGTTGTAGTNRQISAALQQIADTELPAENPEEFRKQQEAARHYLQSLGAIANKDMGAGLKAGNRNIVDVLDQVEKMHKDQFYAFNPKLGPDTIRPLGMSESEMWKLASSAEALIRRFGKGDPYLSKLLSKFTEVDAVDKYGNPQVHPTAGTPWKHHELTQKPGTRVLQALSENPAEFSRRFRALVNKSGMSFGGTESDSRPPIESRGSRRPTENAALRGIDSKKETKSTSSRPVMGDVGPHGSGFLTGSAIGEPVRTELVHQPWMGTLSPQEWTHQWSIFVNSAFPGSRNQVERNEALRMGNVLSTGGTRAQLERVAPASVPTKAMNDYDSAKMIKSSNDEIALRKRILNLATNAGFRFDTSSSSTGVSAKSGGTKNPLGFGTKARVLGGLGFGLVTGVNKRLEGK